MSRSTCTSLPSDISKHSKWLSSSSAFLSRAFAFDCEMMPCSSLRAFPESLKYFAASPLKCCLFGERSSVDDFWELGSGENSLPSKILISAIRTACSMAISNFPFYPSSGRVVLVFFLEKVIRILEISSSQLYQSPFRWLVVRAARNVVPPCHDNMVRHLPFPTFLVAPHRNRDLFSWHWGCTKF